MEKTIYTACMLCLAFTIYGQKTIVSSGGEAIGRKGEASYSIGQVMYNVDVGTTVSSSQGVQHAYEVYELKEAATVPSGLVIEVYPNPTQDIVTIKVNGEAEGFLSYVLFSVSGQKLIEGKLNESHTITMGNYANGVYFIKISINKQPVETFKIIKK